MSQDRAKVTQWKVLKFFLGVPQTLPQEGIFLFYYLPIRFLVIAFLALFWGPTAKIRDDLNVLRDFGLVILGKNADARLWL